MRRGPLLEAWHLTKSFGRRRVLMDASICVHPGELVGVTGENGSGKTTLLKILVGLIHADGGELVHYGRVGYCPQEPLLFDRLTVSENVSYFATAYGLTDWRPSMAYWAERLRFEPALGQPVGELSGGTRQKLNLALALLHEPSLLLLDEPFAAFDWQTYLRFWATVDALRANGRGLIVVSHLVYDRSRFDRVCELLGGELECA